MRPDDEVAGRLWDMLDSARAIQRFAHGRTFEDLLADRQFRKAVEREIEIIGEAARGVPEAYRQEHPDIPWQAIIAQRHVLAHEYGEIKHERIWRVVSVHIPDLIARLEPLVPPPPQDL